MAKTVIILNAPPASGKDTIAELIAEKIGAVHTCFKQHLYECTAQWYGLNLNYFKYIATNRRYKDNTDSVASQKELGGLTPREALIHVSEDVKKPQFGDDYFGRAAANALTDGVTVFSDGGGWLEELQPIIDTADKVLVCRLFRAGYTFNQDSRMYFDKEIEGARVVDIHLEEGYPQWATDEILELLEKL